MKRVIGIATCDKFPEMTSDDRLAFAHLAGDGIKTIPAIWDDPLIKWDGFDHVIIRSTWDYWDKAKAFSAWLDQLGNLGIPMSNPYRVVKWNLDKRYMKDLATKGAPTLSTVWLDRGSTSDLFELLEAQNWAKAVVKPVVSAGGYYCWKTSRETAKADQKKFEEWLGKYDLMVQQFAENIAVEGEWAILFFNGEFSHSLIKQPATGEFRVQERFGGSTQGKEARTGFVEQAQSILNLVDSNCLYARVDGVDVGGKFTLMELELLEPLLYLSCDPHAPKRFADAIREVVR